MCRSIVADPEGQTEAEDRSRRPRSNHIFRLDLSLPNENTCRCDQLRIRTDRPEPKTEAEDRSSVKSSGSVWPLRDTCGTLGLSRSLAGNRPLRYDPVPMDGLS